EGPRERLVEGLAGAGIGDPRPRCDRAGLADVDELTEGLAGVRVVLGGRHDHLAVRALDALDAVLAETGEEALDDRPDTPRVRVLHDMGRPEYVAFRHLDGLLPSFPVRVAQLSLVELAVGIARQLG